MAFPPREEYERIVYTMADSYSVIKSSSLRAYSNSRTTCFIRGSIWFKNGLELRIFEFLDLSDGTLLDYSYTVFYQQERLRWYDPQPHPEVPALQATFPHHRHEPPDIKHNRRPAPGISFDTPNLAVLIADCIELGTTLTQQDSY